MSYMFDLEFLLPPLEKLPNGEEVHQWSSGTLCHQCHISS